MPPVLIIITPLILVVLYIISVYNSLQTIQARISASIQEIGNQLKRQANLIPSLVESAKGYLKHEKDIFDKLTDARKLIDTASKKGGAHIDAALTKLQEVLPRLSVIVESNPELKADSIVKNLMEELRDTADKLMYSRRTLIDLSADFNIKITTFPSNLVASLFSFKAQKGLDTPTSGSHVSVSEAETQDIKVKLD